MAVEITAKLVYTYLFETRPGDKEHYHFCKKCKGLAKQRIDKGYTNLETHVKSCTPDYKEIINDIIEREQANDHAGIAQHFVKTVGKDAKWIFFWLEWIVCAKTNLPFAFVSDGHTRSKVTTERSMGVNTLMKYLLLLADELVLIIKKILPEEFGISFDGWKSKASDHYCGIHARWEEESGVLGECLLSCGPLSRIGEYTAEATTEYIDYVLECYDRNRNSILCITGDNVNVNRCIAADMEIPFVGCHSHRLSLAADEFLATMDHIVAPMKALSDELRTQKNTDKLKRTLSEDEATVYCGVVALRAHETRWSGVFSMLTRILRIYPFLIPANNPLGLDQATRALIPAPNIVDAALNLRNQLEVLNESTLALQRENMTVRLARKIFDRMIVTFPGMENYLKDDAECMRERAAAQPRNIPFYRAVVKIQNGDEGLLTPVEAAAAAKFKRVVPEDAAAQQEVPQVAAVVAAVPGFIENLYAEEQLHGNKRQRTAGRSESLYKPMSFIASTSCVIERLFSQAGNILTDDRASMSPIHLEAMLMLRCNKHLWNVETIQNLLTRRKNERILAAGGVVIAQAPGQQPAGAEAGDV